MLLLPLCLTLFLGASVAALVQPEPTVHAFGGLIAVPLALAGLIQCLARRRRTGQVVAAALAGLPFHVAFAVLAPLAGGSVARALGLGAVAGRAVAFSTGTRNSLVVLPLALAVPGAMPVLPAIIVTQTLVELLAEVIYVRWIAHFGAAGPQTLKS